MVKATLLLLLLAGLVPVRDQGQWQYQSPDVSEWFKSLRQPDHPAVSCCGEADAYYADETDVGPNGETIAIITDTRDDVPLGRQHIDVGTRIVVPAEKVRRPSSMNPTGHTILFVGTGGTVFCYEPQPLI